MIKKRAFLRKAAEESFFLYRKVLGNVAFVFAKAGDFAVKKWGFVLNVNARYEHALSMLNGFYKKMGNLLLNSLPPGEHKVYILDNNGVAVGKKLIHRKVIAFIGIPGAYIAEKSVHKLLRRKSFYFYFKRILFPNKPFYK